jgi:hypothetical protein
MASAKAKTATATALLAEAAGHCAIVAPDGAPAVKLRKALEAADAALKAVFAALEGQVEE